MQLRSIVMGVLVFGGVAQAQPGVDPPPVEPVVDPPPALPPDPPPGPPAVMPAVSQPAPPVAPELGGYPTELVARPLILPDNSFEGGVALVWDRIQQGNDDSFSTVDAVPRARYAAPGVELEGFAGIAVYTTDLGGGMGGFTYERDRLSLIGAAARHGFGANTSLGVELAVRVPGSETPLYQPRLVLASKRRLGALSAVQISGIGGLDHQTFPSMSMPSSRDILIVGGELRAQAQLNSVFGVEGRATLLFEHLLDQPANHENVLAQNFGVRAVVAASPSVDITLGFDLGVFQFQQKIFTLGVIARRVP